MRLAFIRRRHENQVLQNYIKNGFPKSKRVSCGDRDEICRLCGEWVTLNSSCSNRYHVIQGCWCLNEPSFDPRVHGDEDRVATIPICDKCCEYYDVQNKSHIIVMGHRFSIDVVFRGND